MSFEQITLKDIAKKLNLAPSTVSRALKDHPDISRETKQIVMALAKELDYQPNTVALSLRKSKTYTIGVIVPEIVHFFFSTVISGIEDGAYAAGYHVVICQSNEDAERERKNANILMQSRVDGLIVSVSKSTTDFSYLQAIQKKGVPMVFFDRRCKEVDASSVVVEDYQGAYSATEHLIINGYRKIAHLCGPSTLSLSQNRTDGYKDALQKYDITVMPELIVKADTYNEGYYATKSLLEGPIVPDAIFAVNDSTAIGAMKAIKEKGKKMPQEIGVVGFTDDPMLSQLVEPQLTSVAQPGYEMGQLAAKMFLEQIEKGPDNPVIRHEVLKTRLVIRESSGGEG